MRHFLEGFKKGMWFLITLFYIHHFLWYIMYILLTLLVNLIHKLFSMTVLEENLLHSVG